VFYRNYIVRFAGYLLKLLLLCESFSSIKMTDFDCLFRKYHHRLLLYTMKFVESENDAFDIVQNIFVAVWENGKFRENEELVQSYLFAAVKNSCLNYIKHQQVVKKFEHNAAIQIKEMEAIYYSSGEKSLIEKENLELINNAIDSLNDIYREVLILSRFDGLKNSEIAEKLNLPLRTVETRIFRALSILKERISQKSFFILLYLRALKKR
jgi:RNA polymerase sigma-70 factor, ECF subfamily